MKLSFVRRRSARLEDRVLELMSESEPLEKNVKAAEAAFKTEKEQVESEKGQARERTAVNEKASAELQVERSGIVKSLTPSRTSFTNGSANRARGRASRKRSTAAASPAK